MEEIESTDENAQTDLSPQMFSKNLVVFNLRGSRFELQMSSLSKLPQLSKLTKELTGSDAVTLNDIIQYQCVEQKQELYINSNPILFHYILDYLKYSEIHFPESMCIDMIEKELDYWGFQMNRVLSSCCYDRVLKEHDGRKTTLKLTRLWKRMTSAKKRFPCIRNDAGEIESRVKRFQERLWKLLEKPNSSTAAKVWAFIPMLVIIVSVLILVVETVPSVREPSFLNVTSTTNLTEGQGLFKYYMDNSAPVKWLEVIDFSCTIILSIEYILRFIASPRKCRFLIKPLNIADFLGLFPMWAHVSLLIFSEMTGYTSHWMEVIMDTLSFFKLCRTLRFGRIMMLNKQLRMVFLALAHSWQELGIMLSIIFVTAIIFGSLIFYIELHRDNFKTVFVSMWWSIVTMTTVGYGDFYPITEAGYLVGVVCSVSGIVLIALTTTIIVNHFLVTLTAVENYERSIIAAEHVDESDGEDDDDQSDFHIASDIIDKIGKTISKSKHLVGNDSDDYKVNQSSCSSEFGTPLSRITATEGGKVTAVELESVTQTNDETEVTDVDENGTEKNNVGKKWYQKSKNTVKL